jgi:glycosyltransferase involved in cell wall biosynthesis
MRILLLNQFYPPDTASTGQHLADVAEALARAGHDVHVVCSRRAYGGGAARYPAEERAAGVRVHRVAATGFGRTTLSGRLADYASFYALAAAKAAALPAADVCVALTTPPFIGVAGLLLSVLRGTRLVLWSMDVYPEVAVAYGVVRAGGAVHGLLCGIARALYHRAAAIISLGPVMTRRLVRAGADPARIAEVDIWVPREAVRFIPPRRPSGTPDAGGRPVTVMYSGNMGLGHDLATAVRAIAALPARSVRALFVGEGKGRPGVERLVAELGLGCVEFAPPRPLAELSEGLAAGDVHLVSQRPETEGLIVPCKLYGVLAAGRPVVFIGPEDCELADVVRRSGAGAIVPPGDVPAAARALRRLLDDPQLRLRAGRKARAFYERNFGRQRSVAKVVDVITCA